MIDTQKTADAVERIMEIERQKLPISETTFMHSVRLLGDLLDVIKVMGEAFKYIEHHLEPCSRAEMGVHRAGDVNPYYTSWNDGEFAIQTSWHHAGQAIRYAAPLMKLKGEG